ncbi:MAG: VIT domain-containing protein [Polyangiales bacterium]
MISLVAMSCAACHRTEALQVTVAQVEPVRGGVSAREDRAATVADSVLRLRPGAVVETDGSGRALVSLDDGDRLLLDRATRLRVVDSTHVEVAAGRVWLNAAAREARDPSGLELRAGGGTLRARGVSASVRLAGSGVEVDVLGGELAYRAGARQGTLRAGEHGALSERGAEVAPSALFDDWTGGLADGGPTSPGGGAAEGVGAVAARRPDEQGAPRWPLAVQRLESRVRVVGDLAITEVEQTFFNPSSDTVEGIYTLRVPRGAVLQRFAVDRRGTLVDGTVRERQLAARQYQAQVYAGSTLDPALLEWDAPGRYHARLYPIGPGQTRRLLVTYSQWLPARDDGGRSWRLPLAALGARIGELYVNLDLERAGAREVRAGLGAVRDEQHVVLSRTDFLPRSDFVVDLRGDAPHAATLARLAPPEGSDSDRSDFVRVAVRPPLPAVRAATSSMDLVLLVDHSAATDAASLQLQQDMAEAITRSLGPDDRLLILAGDVRTRAVGPSALTSVTSASVSRALDALAADLRGGATDLGAMVDAAQGSLDPGRNGVIVYLGDGRATVGEDQRAPLRARLDRMQPRPRLYAVALGEDADMDVLSAIAEPSGFATHVRRRAEVASSAIEILSHASRPLVRGLRVELGPDVERVYPVDPVDLPVGETLVAVGRIRAPSPRTVRVRGSWLGAEISQSLAVSNLVLPADGDLRARWATARLESLLARGEARAVVVELGSRFGLITPFTSLYVPAEDAVVAARPRALSPFDLIPFVGCSRSAPHPTEARAPAAAAAPQQPESSTVAAQTTPTRAPRNAPSSGLDPSHAEPSDDEVGASGGGGEGERTRAATTEAPAEPSPEVAVETTDALQNGVMAAAPAPPPAQRVAGNAGLMGAHSARPRGRFAVAQQAQPFGQNMRGGEDIPEAQPQLGAESLEAAVDGDGLSGRGEEQVRDRRSARELDTRRALARCSDAAAVSLAERLPLWSERLRAGGAPNALAVWNRAKTACELPAWPDRLAMLRLMISKVRDVDGQLWLYEHLRGDRGAREWLRASLLRTLARSGELGRAHALGLHRLDDDTLTAALAQARTPAERLNVLRQLARRFRDDLDLSLLLLDAAVVANDPAEARRVASRLRSDPRADARVRTAAGEALLAIGDEAEARRAFSEIVEFAPDDPFSRRLPEHRPRPRLGRRGVPAGSGPRRAEQRRARGPAAPRRQRAPRGPPRRGRAPR